MATPTKGNLSRILIWVAFGILFYFGNQSAVALLVHVPYISRYWGLSAFSLYAVGAIVVLVVWTLPILHFAAPVSQRRWLKPALIIEAVLLIYFVVLMPNRIYLFVKHIHECPDCDFTLAGFNLLEDRHSHTQLKQWFDAGCSPPAGHSVVGPYSYSRWYFLPRENVVVQFGRNPTGDVLELRQPIGQEKTCKSSATFKTLATGKGISLGADKKFVLDTYGLPSDEITSIDGITHVEYQKDGAGMNFDVVNDKIIAIRTSVSTTP